MKHQLAAFIDSAITFLLLVVAGLTPLLFLNQTTEFYEMPKLILLVASTVLLLGLWIFSWILKGKIVITRTPLDIPLVILLVVVLLSTYFSGDRYPAIYGNFPRVHGSALAWVTYILLYFVTVSNLTSLGKIRAFLYALYASGVVVAVLTLLSFFGIFLPFDFARGVNFTPTGSSFSTVALLLLLLPFPLLSILVPNKYLPLPVAMLLALLFGVTIALVGSLATYIILLATVALCLLVLRPQQVKKSVALYLVPVLVISLTLALAYLPLPGGLNFLQQREANYPKEIQLPFATSWKISASAFRDEPFIGTGPSTYLFNFTTYKPLEFNQLQFWNFSFDTAHNEFLQMLGTLGIFGLIALVLLSLIVINTARKNMSTENPVAMHEHTHVLLPALAISGLVTVALFAIHATTLVSLVVSLFMLAALMMSQRSVREKVMEFSMGLKASTGDNKQFDLLPVIVFIIFLVAAVPLVFRGYNVVAADYYHRKALASAGTNGTQTYQFLQRAETLNPYIDLYRIDMAQTNFALANAIAAQKGPTAENPQGTLTDTDRQTIQTLISQAVNEGRVATALSPRSSRNWEVLASIYRNITGVANNALTFSLDAYGRAIQRDPLNPALRVNVGGMYYAAQNYDLAIRFFSDAANLKPDYVNAYYNLAIALRDKGDLQNAQAVAQQAVTLLNDRRNTPDFKTASALLSDLRAAAATGSAQQNGQQPPAAQTNSALNNQDLENIDVDNLNNPPQPATPAAVRRNPNTNLPRLNQNQTQPQNGTNTNTNQ